MEVGFVGAGGIHVKGVRVGLCQGRHVRLEAGQRRRSVVTGMTQSSASSRTAPIAPSWQDLALKIPNDFLNPDYLNGEPRATPPWERDCVRLFGKTEDDIQFIFYRDTSYW